MNSSELIALAKRKNEAHKTLIKARHAVRKPAKYNGMTEADRDIEMESLTREEREKYENLCDEWTVRLMEYEHGVQDSNG